MKVQGGQAPFDLAADSIRGRSKDKDIAAAAALLKAMPGCDADVLAHFSKMCETTVWNRYVAYEECRLVPSSDRERGRDSA